MAEARHQYQAQADGLHSPYRWLWADATAKDAETDVTDDDVDNRAVGLQEDYGIAWRPTATAPTWQQVGGDKVVHRSVTHGDASWYELFLDGAATQLLIAADIAWTFTILIVGTTQGATKTFSFYINGVVENDGGTTSILASNVTTIYDGDDVSFDARVTADDANDALSVEVQDSDGASDVVKWVGSVRLIAVNYPA